MVQYVVVNWHILNQIFIFIRLMVQAGRSPRRALAQPSVQGEIQVSQGTANMGHKTTQRWRIGLAIKHSYNTCVIKSFWSGSSAVCEISTNGKIAQKREKYVQSALCFNGCGTGAMSSGSSHWGRRWIDERRVEQKGTRCECSKNGKKIAHQCKIHRTTKPVGR